MMIKEHKDIEHVGRYIGLARRAGKITAGFDAVKAAIYQKKAVLVLVSDDASVLTDRRIRHLCSVHKVACAVVGSKEGMGHYLGKASVAVAAITDRSFASAIIEMLCDIKPERVTFYD